MRSYVRAFTQKINDHYNKTILRLQIPVPNPGFLFITFLSLVSKKKLPSLLLLFLEKDLNINQNGEVAGR
jgi:hypothetical protein